MFIVFNSGFRMGRLFKMPWDWCGGSWRRSFLVSQTQKSEALVGTAFLLRPWMCQAGYKHLTNQSVDVLKVVWKLNGCKEYPQVKLQT